MTELIDLATLANLGQHFSTHEDVAELKATLTSVQTDLALIKKFLFQQYGSDFSSALRQGLAGDDNQHTQMPVVKKTVSVPVVQKVNKASAPPQRKPPPLQRFSRVSSNDDEVVRHLSKNVTVFRQQSSNGGGNTSIGGGGSGGRKIAGTSSGTTIKSEKFHRNFLSMKSLNKSRTASGGSSASSSLSNGGNNSAIFLMNKISGGGSTIRREIKVEPQQISPGGSSGSGGGGGGNKMPRLKAAVVKSEIYGNGMHEEFNVSEDAAYAAVADDEGNFVEETGGDEEDYAYGGYDVNEDYEQGDYDDPITQMEYQDEDGTIYEEDYSEANELIDANGSLGLIRNVSASSAQLLNGVGGRRMMSTSTTTGRKTPQQRRISLPISSSQGSMDPSQEGDPNYTKKCKVCHADVPSYSLFNHVIATHYNGEVPTCSICKKTFTYKQGLISHMRYHDAEKYDKACSYCGKKFIRRSDVIIHERRLHTGERPYLCPVPECNQGFVRRYCLLTHVKTNHGEPYMSQLVAEGRRKSS